MSTGRGSDPSARAHGPSRRATASTVARRGSPAWRGSRPPSHAASYRCHCAAHCPLGPHLVSRRVIKLHRRARTDSGSFSPHWTQGATPPLPAELAGGGVAVDVVHEAAFELAGWGCVVVEDGVAVAMRGGPVHAVGAAADFVHADVFGAVVAPA